MMNIFLSFNSGAQSLQLPVLPESFEISTGLNNNTFEVVNLGEIGIVGNRKLSTITISSFFPKYYSSYCQYTSIPDPYDAVKKIEGWRDSKKPVRLKISDTPINMACMIEEFNYGEKGGQPGDVYYDLSLKEYRFIQQRVITKSNGTTTLSVKSSRASDKQSSSKYTVKQGDTLYTIAKRVYNDGTRWKELYEKNTSIIGKDPNLIKPGQVLTL